MRTLFAHHRREQHRSYDRSYELLEPFATSLRPKEELLEELLRHDDDTISWIVHEACNRPSVRRSVHQGILSNKFSNVLSCTTDGLEEVQETVTAVTARSNAEPEGEETLCPTIVQFDAPVYFCSEDERNVRLMVERIGELNNPIKVNYSTRDGTATGNVSYTPARGTLNFGKGEVMKEVLVPIISNKEWGIVSEFSVELKEEGISGAMLGRDLWKTSVKIIDEDTFPTSKFRKLLEGGQVDALPPYALFWEYIKLQLQQPVIRKGTIKTMLAGSVGIFYKLFQIFVMLCLVDHVLSKDPDEVHPHAQHFYLGMCSLATMLPMLIVHVVKFHEPFGVGTHSRKLLQDGLICKFLNYDATHREVLRSEILVLVIKRDIHQLVDSGFKNIIGIAVLLIELVLTCAFPPVISLVQHHQINYITLAPLVCLPCAMVTFMICRHRVTTHTLAERNKQEDALALVVDDIAGSHQLLSDFQCRGSFLKLFEDAEYRYHAARKCAKHVLVNNKYFGLWVAVVLLGLYIFVGGRDVTEGHVSLGMFLANTKVIQQMGRVYGEIYGRCLEVINVFPHLEHITRLMNLPQDTTKRMRCTRHNEVQSFEYFEKLKTDGPGTGYTLDHLPILVKDYKHAHVGHAGLRKNSGLSDSPCEDLRHLVFKGRMEVTQGQLVVFIGPVGEGKSTLLSLIGGALLPDIGGLCESEVFFIPSHMRVVHVSSTPLFMYDTLLNNLTLGLPEDHPDKDLSRISLILKDLGLPEDGVEFGFPGHTLTSLLQSDVMRDWTKCFSMTQRHLLNLARALIVNPNLLCMHRPLNVFGDPAARRILKVFKNHINNRGLRCDSESRHRRRPRTIILTSSRGISVKVADRVYHISRSRGVQEIRQDEATSEMLGQGDERL